MRGLSLFRIALVLCALPFLDAKKGSRGPKGKGRGNGKNKLSKNSATRVSILDIAEANFTTFASALKAANLDWIYDCTRRCRDATAFAPTDQAFAAVNPELLAALTTDPMMREHLTQFLEYHVLKNVDLSSNQLRNDTSYRTVQGGDIQISVTGSIIQLNAAATVTQPDFAAANGVLHGIDSVLMPNFLMTDLVEIIRADNDFSTLTMALDAVPALVTTLKTGNYTFFAPDNNAFIKLSTNLTALLADTATLANILSYHTVPNQLIQKYDFRDGFLTTLQGSDLEVDVSRRRVELNDGAADVDRFNKLASNAIIHTIDRVLMPPAPLVDLVTTARSNALLDTFVQAATAASLLTTLQGTGPFTCFLPTDEAFDKLSNATLTALLANETALSPLLMYHCVAGTILRDDIKDSRLTTLQGEEIEVDRRSRGRIRINDNVDVVAYDIRATNGVIHLIDEVLELPLPLLTIADYLASDSEFETLSVALQQAGLDTDLKAPGNFTLFAPDNRAFERFGATNLKTLLNDTTRLTDLLNYHVVADEEIYKVELEDKIVQAKNGKNLRIDVRKSGRKARLNGNVKVREFDMVCSNGVIHQIKDVLTVPVDLNATLQAYGLTSLSAAVVAAGVDGLLASADSTFTLFAPSNRAFTRAVGLDALNQTALRNIVDYHLVPGSSLLADDLVEGTLATVQGGTIDLDFRGKNQWLQINDNAWVFDYNIVAANGVIHIMNQVLNPVNGVASP